MENNKGAAEMVDRKEGYYWVKRNSVFEIAKWDIGSWWGLINDDASYFDEDFSEIDERQICRSENAANICPDCGGESHIQVYCNICDNDE